MIVKLFFTNLIALGLFQMVSTASTSINPPTINNQITSKDTNVADATEDGEDEVLENGEDKPIVAPGGFTPPTSYTGHPTTNGDYGQDAQAWMGSTTDSPFLRDPTIVEEIDLVQVPIPTNPAVPECLTSDGSFPNWLDDTCSSFVVCQNFVPLLQTCPEGEVYSALEKDCVTMTILSCHVTNEAMKVANDAFSLLRGSFTTILNRRIKRSTDQMNENKKGDNLEIKLPSTICEVISGDTNFFEANMNNLIRINAKCPRASSCNIPSMSFSCETSETFLKDEDVPGVGDEN